MKQPATRELDGTDEGWISHLTQELPSPAWFGMANESLTQDQLASSDGRISATWPRINFYENLMAFSDPASPLHAQYVRLSEARRALIPIGCFVDSMRTFEGEGVDVLAVSLNSTNVWSQLGSVITQRIAGLEQVLGRDEAIQLVETKTDVLAWRDYARKIGYALQVGNLLGWDADEARRLPFIRPQALGASWNRLAVHAQLFARFGKPDFKAMRIGGLLLEHPDRQLVALMEGIDDYTYRHVRKVTSGMAAQDCAIAAREILARPLAEQNLGSGLVRAHRKFQAKHVSL